MRSIAICSRLLRNCSVHSGCCCCCAGGGCCCAAGSCMGSCGTLSRDSNNTRDHTVAGCTAHIIPATLLEDTQNLRYQARGTGYMCSQFDQVRDVTTASVQFIKAVKALGCRKLQDTASAFSMEHVSTAASHPRLSLPASEVACVAGTPRLGRRKACLVVAHQRASQEGCLLLGVGG